MTSVMHLFKRDFAGLLVYNEKRAHRGNCMDVWVVEFVWNSINALP